MIGLAAFDRFCGKLPGASFVVQWGGSHVHKLGPKIFAVAMDGGYVFKATPMAFAVLREQGVAVRAPYLRQGHWLRVEPGALKQAELFSHIEESHRLVAAALTRAMRQELGLG